MEQAFKFLYKDPDKNMLKIIDWADKFAGDQFVIQRKMIREAMTNPEHPYYGFIRHVLNDIDPNVMKTTAVNFLFMQLWLDGRSRKRIGKSMGATFPGRFCWILPAPVICIVQDAGRLNMAIN